MYLFYIRNVCKMSEVLKMKLIRLSFRETKIVTDVVLFIRIQNSLDFLKLAYPVGNSILSLPIGSSDCAKITCYIEMYNLSYNYIKLQIYRYFICKITR